MFASQCLFCDHVNPAGAKFCNNCGSQLHVKQCSRCGAINDQAAKTCFKCEMEIPVLSGRVEASPMPPTGNTTSASPAAGEGLPFRFDFLDELPKPAPFAIEAAGTQTSGAPEASFATASSNAPQLDRAAAAIERDEPDRTRELPRPANAAIEPAAAQTSGAPEPSFATPNSLTSRLDRPRAIETSAELRPTSRVARVVSATTVGLIAIGILAYYVYSPSAEEGRGEHAISAAPETVNSRAPLTRPIQEIGVNAFPAPPASLGAGSDDAVETGRAARAVEPSISASRQDGAAATGSNRADSQTPPPNRPRRQITTSDQASPTQRLAPRAQGLVNKPSAPSADAGDSRDAASLRACTEGVAALGLCSPNSKGGSK